MGGVDVRARLQHRVLGLRVLRGAEVAAVGLLALGMSVHVDEIQENILGNPRGQDDVVGTVRPRDGERVVGHVAAPGPPSPADIMG